MNLIVKPQNPFQAEYLRDYFARQHKISEFKQTYLQRLPSIQNVNTKAFWNKNISQENGVLLKSSVYRDKIKTIVKFISKNKGKLLDVGFGYGFLEKILSGNNKLKLYGIDVSTLAVKNALISLPGVYKVGKISKIPFRAKIFDIALVLDVMEHIPPRKTFLAFKEILRVLKDDGLLIISVPLNEDLENMIRRGRNPNGHVRVYTPIILKTELKLFGFKIIKIKYLYAFQKNYMLKNLFLRVFPFKIKEPNLMIILAKK